MYSMQITGQPYIDLTEYIGEYWHLQYREQLEGLGSKVARYLSICGMPQLLQKHFEVKMNDYVDA